MYLLAFLCAWGLPSYRAKQRDGWTPTWCPTWCLFALGVVLGGRWAMSVLWVRQNSWKIHCGYFRSGLGAWASGGFLGVMIAMLFWCRNTKTWFQTLDFIAPVYPQAWCSVVSAIYWWWAIWSPGDQSWLSFGMIFPTDPLGLVRHPSQIYQALCGGFILFMVLWWFSSKPRPRMAVSALFLMGYGVARFFMEFFRQPDADQGFILFGWMTKGQILSFPMIIIGLWMMVRLLWKKSMTGKITNKNDGSWCSLFYGFYYINYIVSLKNKYETTNMSHLFQPIDRINHRYRLGNATEHTFRGDLAQLIESMVPDITGTNEPKRQSCGAPDYITTKENIPIWFYWNKRYRW